MITVQEHLQHLLSEVRPVREVRLPLPRAHGRVLTEDVLAQSDLPRFDCSAMDGYAVRAADLEGVDPEHPRNLPVEGDIAAGDGTPHTLVPGRAWRILTGAPVPEGADAIVPVEDTDGRPREVLVRRAPEEGAHIRRRGEDLTAGDLLLARGTRLGPAQVGALAAAGAGEVTVTGPVRVVVLSTGNELIPAGTPAGAGHITDSNGPMLAAAVREAGHYAVHAGRLPDDPGRIRDAVRHHLDHADAIVTTGGVSMGGEYDAVKEVLSGEGSMRFTEVAMRPGKPQGFGLLGRRRVPVFTLPGNPVSALVSFEVFVRPALARRAGSRYQPVTLPALVTRGWESPEGKRQFVPVRVERDLSGSYACVPTGPAGSHRMASAARADGLAEVTEEVTEVRAGEELPVRPLRPVVEIETRLVAEEERRAELEADTGNGRGRHRWRG